MAVEIIALKPVVEALMKLITYGNNKRLSRAAEQKIQEAIKELFLANPDECKVEAALMSAEAAKLLSPDVIFTKDALAKVRLHKKVATAKAATKRSAGGRAAKKIGARKLTAKKARRKKVAARKRSL